MADLRYNDEAIAFFAAQGYPTNYNDGMLAWLRAYYFTSGSTLPDLLKRYKDENGFTMLPQFSPSNLFQSSEPGAWYDMTDLSTMWQDTGGTTPVTAAGQQCARLDDKSGNGHHATQSTGTKQPIVRQDANGVYYLEFDGTDDELINGTMDLSASQESLFALGGITSNDATSQGYPFNFGGNYQLAGNAGFLLAVASTGSILVGGRSTIGGTGAVSTGFAFGKTVPFVLVGVIDFSQAAGSEVYAISNGSRIEQDNGLSDNNTGVLKSSGSVYIGSRGGAVFYEGDIYCCVVRGGSSTELEATRLSHSVNLAMEAY